MAIVTDGWLERILNSARALYRDAPAHGLPMLYKDTGKRTHCVISAIYTAAYEDGVPQYAKPVLAAFAKANGISKNAVPTWEQDTSTAKVCAAFNRALPQAVPA